MSIPLWDDDIHVSKTAITKHNSISEIEWISGYLIFTTIQYKILIPTKSLHKIKKMDNIIFILQ